MQEKITPYLKQQLQNPSIAAQYLKINTTTTNALYNDPLMEDAHEVVKGLVHKYANRALIKVSYRCAAHCQFCTRSRQIGSAGGDLQELDINSILAYLKSNVQINDVILSGGDPFFTPAITKNILEKIANLDSIKTIRIGTRMPVHAPNAFASKTMLALLETIKSIAAIKPFFIMLHFEHPAELTNETIAVIQQIKSLGVTLFSQTVFLKNINDNFEILYQLFTKLYHHNVLPYYLYHCDNVKGLEHFMGDLKQEKIIAQKLRATLSGLACPLFVIDVENGYGKIPV